MFGHEKGAFTGAIATDRRFDLAHRKHFLDEVSDVPLELQPKYYVCSRAEFED